MDGFVALEDPVGGCAESEEDANHDLKGLRAYLGCRIDQRRSLWKVAKPLLQRCQHLMLHAGRGLRSVCNLRLPAGAERVIDLVERTRYRERERDGDQPEEREVVECEARRPRHAMLGQ